MLYVSIRAPPRSTKLTELLPSDSETVVPLDQLWTRLPPDRRQDVLRRFTQMIVQQLAQPLAQREAGHE